VGRLENKVAIITGAANGQGAFEAKLFAKEGAKVVATDIDFDNLKKVVAEIREAGGESIAIKQDVSSEEQWKQVVHETVETYGKIDILVNNAGIHYETALEDIKFQEWDRVIQVNLNSVFLGTRSVVPEMKKNGGGSIINIASIAAMIGGSFAHYSAAKGGVRSLTKVTAIEYAKDNIRANSVYPGLIVTDLVKEALANEAIRKKLEAANPLPRFGTVEDVAYGVLYLASDESSYVTGLELVIDGGTTSQ